MKAIMAYVQPFILEKVTETLRAKHIHGVTVIQCQGFGRPGDGKVFVTDVTLAMDIRTGTEGEAIL